MSHALMAVRRGRRNVVRLRLRRPIREKPNIRLPFAALVTKPGEKTRLPAFRPRAGGVSAVVCHPAAPGRSYCRAAANYYTGSAVDLI